MYARSTTIRGNPQALDEGIAYVRDKVMPAVQQMDGCVGLSMLVDRESGRCIVTTAWADAEDMRNSSDGVRSIREKAAEILGGTPEVQEWEIAVLHRMHDAGDGARTRVIWGHSDPAQMDQLLDTFRTAMLPKVEQLPGFRSLNMMVDRETGRTALAVTYENAEAMERANEQAAALRQEADDMMGLKIDEVAEFDLVVAHLRVPETV